MTWLNWRDTCKFLSGIAFANGAMNVYFFVCQKSIPFLNSILVDGYLAQKAALQLGLFSAFFYLGFCTQVQRETESVIETRTTQTAGVASLTSTEHVA